MVKSKFPNADMISDGEVKNGVISQNPNYTSRENGRPGQIGYPFAALISDADSYSKMAKNQGVGEQTVHGMEEVDYESPMYRGLRAAAYDDDYTKLPCAPTPKKVGW